MKKHAILILGAIIAFIGCAKQETSIDDQAPSPQKGKRYVTVEASISSPDVKSEVSDDGTFVWNTGDKIGVYTNLGNMHQFNYKAGSGKTFESEGEFEAEETVSTVAIAPYSSDNKYVVDGEGNYLEIKLPGTFDWVEGNTNAVMLATGLGASAEAEQVFEFHHIGAILKFTYENVPTGSKYFSLTTKTSSGDARNIAGTFHLNNAGSNFSDVALVDPSSNGTDNVIIEFDEVKVVNTSMSFFVAVPTGDYSKFQLALLDKELGSISGSKKKVTCNVTLSPADVLVFPVITLAEETPTAGDYEKVTSDSELTDGQYLIVYETSATTANVLNGANCVDGTDNVLSGVSITSEGKIEATNSTNNAAFTYDATNHTLINKDGKYLTGGAKKISVSDDSSTNTISIDNSANAVIYGSSSYLRYNTDGPRFRYYADNTSCANIQLYKKADNTGALSTPRNLSVTGRRVAWDAVSKAASYTVTVDDKVFTGITNTYYDLTSDTTDEDYLVDGYYDVSVVAVSGDDKRTDSSPATLTKAKVGTPRLDAPTGLSLVSNTLYSREFGVKWNEVSDAESYHYSVKAGEVEVTSGSTDELSVLIEGLSGSTTYSVTVYAEATTGDYPYAQSAESAAFSQATPADETLSSISDTKVHKVYGLTVGAVSTAGFYVYDATAGMMVVQSTTAPSDIAVGDLVDVKGTTGTENGVYHFKSGVTVSNKRSGTPAENPYSLTTVDATELSSLSSSFSKKYLSVLGTVKTVNKGSGYYNIQVGTETSKLIALHAPITAIKDAIAVNQEVKLTGFTYKMTGSTTKYIYIVADSFSIIQLVATPTTASWSSWDSVEEKKITVTSDNDNWTFNDSAVSSWLTVAHGTGDDANKLILTPKSTNNSTSARGPANITLTHATIPEKTVTIACSMPAKPTVKPVTKTQTGRYVSLACEDTGATIKYVIGTGDPASGTTYSAPIAFETNGHLRAVAIMDGYFNSEVLDADIEAPAANLSVSGDASLTEEGGNKVLTLGGTLSTGAKTLSVTSYYAWNAAKGGSDTFTFMKKNANGDDVAAGDNVDVDGSIIITPPSDADAARDLGTLTLTDSKGNYVNVIIKQAAAGSIEEVNAPSFTATLIANTTSTVEASSSITISTTTPGATIYYTTDGSIPTSSSEHHGTVGASSATVAAAKTIKAITVKNNVSSSVVTATYTLRYKDIITVSDLAATGTTYTGFSNVSISSKARYAGNSAKDNSGNIQLRSKSSNSGIVSTTTGGNVVSVRITVGSGSNTVDVYGSTSAYSSASDLYGDNRGTKVGSTSSTTTINFPGNTSYQYVGIRSNSGAIYLSSVEIVWDD